jgi:hypothetical protein
MVLAATPQSALAASDPPLQITPEIPPRSVSAQGEVFLDQTFIFTTTDGRVVVTSTADGTGQVHVDDEIDINVTHADGSTAEFVRNYEFQPPSDPLDLSSVLEPGANRLHVILRDTFGVALGSTPLYLVGSGKPMDLAAGIGIAIKELSSQRLEGCTNGPAVTKELPEGRVRFFLTAHHCFDGTPPNTPPPMTLPEQVLLQTPDHRAGAPVSDTITSCNLKGPVCLQMNRPDKGYGDRRDVIAWRPNGPIVTNLVHTGPDTLHPAVSGVSIGRGRAIGNGDFVCTYGVSSGTQRCGPVLKQRYGRINNDGIVVLRLCSLPGDSGGPAYVHTKNDRGVRIAGIVLGNTGEKKHEDCNRDSQTAILTLDKIKDQLGVKLFIG